MDDTERTLDKAATSIFYITLRSNISFFYTHFLLARKLHCIYTPTSINDNSPFDDTGIH